MGQVVRFMKKHIDHLKVTFNSQVNFNGNDQNDNFCALQLLKKVYNTWSGMTFKRTKGKQSSDSYITCGTDIYNYVRPKPNPEEYDICEIMRHLDDY